MNPIDYNALADQLESSGGGPTVAQHQRDQRMLDLMEKLLASQPTQQAPVVHVAAPSIDVPPAQVVVHPSPAPARCAWRFEFERNGDGTIKSITANPV